MSFSGSLQIELGGLIWLLQTPHKYRVAAEWSRHNRSFAVLGVEPALKVYCAFNEDGEEEVTYCLARTDFSQDEYPFKQVDVPELGLGKEFRCKACICMEAVASAETFPEVLNALYEFSAWYIDSSCLKQAAESRVDDQMIRPLPCQQMKNSDFQQSIQDSIVPDGQISQLELNHPSGTSILLDQAKEASMMCEVAAEALNDVSQAAANMLSGLLQQISSMYRGETVVDDPEVANNHLGRAVPHNLLARTIQEAHTKAIRRDGCVLQWCSISTVDCKSSLIECKIELGEFLDEEVARCVGISIDEPLIIRIFADSKEVGIRQDAHKGHSIATAFLLPHIVKKYLLQCFETAPFVDDENLFIRLFQHIAGYLSDLESICLVCGNPHHLRGRMPRACTHTRCQATLESWARIAPLGMTEVSMLPAAPRPGSNSVSVDMRRRRSFPKPMPCVYDKHEASWNCNRHIQHL